MEKFGLLFSGQGAQYPQMGMDLYNKDPLFKETIDRANAVLTNMDLVAVLNNEDDALSQTKYVQPAIVAVSLGLFTMLKRDIPELPIQAMLGLSLGEYAALIASGVLEFEEGMQILQDRASYMQADAQAKASKMAALLQPDIDLVKQICQDCTTNEETVSIANYNSPKQVVIGGSVGAVQKAMTELAEKGGAKKVVELKVSGAFHTPLFVNASQKMAKRLSKVTFAKSNVPVISNTTYQPFDDKVADTLVKQLISPTHFASCSAYMFDKLGVNAVLELGPGDTLCKFVKQVDRKVARYHIENYEGYQAFLDAIRGN